MQFSVYQVNLSKIGTGRVARDTGTMFNGLSHMRIAIHTKPR